MTSRDDIEATNPWHIVDIQRIDVDTITRIMAKLKVSHGLDQLAYREAELDELWNITHMAVRAGVPGAEVALTLLWKAHDSVGYGEVLAALDALESLTELPNLEALNGE